MKIWIDISDEEFLKLQEFSAGQDINGEEIVQWAVAQFLNNTNF